MKSLTEYINENTELENSVNEGYTLDDIGKISKKLADFRKKNQEGTMFSMIGIFLSTLHGQVDSKDKEDIKKICKIIEDNKL